MQSIHDLETPAVLIDLDRLEANVARMAGKAREAGVGLRPHAKTHKVPEIGRMQMRAGAVGLSFAKTSEAEVFAQHGFTVRLVDVASGRASVSDNFRFSTPKWAWPH